MNVTTNPDGMDSYNRTFHETTHSTLDGGMVSMTSADLPFYGPQCVRSTGGTSLGPLSHSSSSDLRDLSGSCLGCMSPTQRQALWLPTCRHSYVPCEKILPASVMHTLFARDPMPRCTREICSCALERQPSWLT